MTGTILIGDCMEQLRTLPDCSAQCCVTSPPYWGLRDYGVNGQLGLEPTPEAYCQRMVDVFREVRRVLRDDGTLWLNVGDGYSQVATARGKAYQRHANVRSQGWEGTRLQKRDIGRGLVAPKINGGLKPKDLVGIPWRLAFALQADGWYLRSDIVWAKPNPMPESVTDRPTKSHEMVFLLSKSQRYYWDGTAVREPHAAKTLTHRGGGRFAGRANHEDVSGLVASANMGAWDRPRVVDPRGRNLRDVWTIPTEPTAEAHFATMPCALVEPCIKSGTSERGCCPQCGAPWRRVVEKEKVEDNTHLRHDNPRAGIRGSGLYRPPKTKAASQELGWTPACKCDAGDPQACVVLDPFFGAGTVGLVAERLGRSYIGIELNPEYAEIARRRIATNGKVAVVAPDPQEQGRLFGGEGDAA